MKVAVVSVYEGGPRKRHYLMSSEEKHIMKQRLLTCALLLPLTLAGCKQSDPKVTPPPPQVAKEAADANTYTLKIAFFGLIAFVQDADKVHALLVNADYGSDPTEEQLPPGVFSELPTDPGERADELKASYPPHRARIRFRNAHIVAGNVPDPRKGQSIWGKDVTFSNNVQGISVDLSSLSRSRKIAATRGLSAVEATGFSSLDQVDPDLLSTTLDTQRLSARALITAGTVVAKPITDCGGDTTYSFKTAANSFLECPGRPEDAVKLAEEVVVTQENVLGQTVIAIGSDSITIEPDDPQKPVVIEIVNQIDEALDDPDKSFCEMDHLHLTAFRWFYRLLMPSAQRASAANHFFPCVQRGVAGGAKCPEVELGNGG